MQAKDVRVCDTLAVHREQYQEGIDQLEGPEDDRKAILTVIDAETHAYLKRDYEVWASHWGDGPDIQRVNTHVGAGVTVVSGPQVRAQMQRIMTANPELREPTALRKENMNVVISDKMAWVTYDQIGDANSIPSEMAGRYHQLKILHKVDGAWKIACLVESQFQADDKHAPCFEVDETAHILEMNEAARICLAGHPLITVQNKHLHIASPNVQKELLNTLSWIASIRDRTTLCIQGEVATRAIAMGQDATGLAQICWAILRDGKLLITFDDPVRLDRKLDIAAQVYRLSDAQKRLIRHLVDGKDIGSAAATLGISRNTAKTHLQRIYDKTGIRSQPALVRLLLNADQHGL